jgi:hypothetical protein
METLVPLVVGFVLTTVLGGLLGSYLQRRSWDHQNEARLREEELRRADAVCQSVSRLLDKRRYRMLRLASAVLGRAGETVSAEALSERFSDYDRVLYEWNDSLNVNLAMVGTYFGEDGRDLLEEASETYRQFGGELEDAYRAVELVPLLVRFALFSGFGSRGRGGPRPDRRATCGLPRGLSTPA